MKRFISLIIVALTLSTLMSSTLFAAEKRFENYQIFGPLPGQDDGRSYLDCVADLTDFLYITIGSGFTKPGSDFVDYWRDFFLYSTHYADVYGVQRQLYATRYAVISTYLRCEKDRYKQVTARYYQLEAELYFVRHFIDTFSDGFPDRVTLDEKRKQFAQEVISYIVAKSPDPEDKNKQIAVYSGYFDQFMAKYGNKVNEYRDDKNSSDPAWGRLKEKFEKLMLTFSQFGTQVKGLGGDAQDLGEALVPDTEKNSSVLGSLVSSVANRFDACAEVGSADSYCVSDAVKYLKNHDSAKDAEKKVEDLLNAKRTNSSTFTDVQFAVDVQNQQKGPLISREEMLQRYEVLYGGVGSSGIQEMISSADTLLDTITKGSLEPLKKVSQCADNIEDKQCK